MSFSFLLDTGKRLTRRLISAHSDTVLPWCRPWLAITKSNEPTVSAKNLWENQQQSGGRRAAT